jgi:Arc/MetJ-type ribon-helix-helix transcriptional regulator
MKDYPITKSIKFPTSLVREIEDLVDSRQYPDFSTAIKHFVKIGMIMQAVGIEKITDPQLRNELDQLKEKSQFLQTVEEWKEKHPEILRAFNTMYNNGLLDPNTSQQQKILIDGR